MSSKRQSSVEWLKSVLTKRSRRHFLPVGECVIIKLDALNELLEQAKQLHEQEIFEAWIESSVNQIKVSRAIEWGDDFETITAQQYYQDTYGE